VADVNRSIWELAEVGLEERESSAILVGHLRDAGFDVQVGISGMPTAFVASYGSQNRSLGSWPSTMPFPICLNRYRPNDYHARREERDMPVVIADWRPGLSEPPWP
jgi:hypothetical protein